MSYYNQEQKEIDNDEIRTDEDRIIDTLIATGNGNLYEDMDFLPLRQSLYFKENVVPEYDDEVSQNIEWARPNDMCDHPAYFNPSYKQQAIIGGSLPDSNFLGCLIAICVYSKYDLIENIFASRPEDFIKYGIFTCRFYVDGEWVEVITDTYIPCFKNNMTGLYRPAYGRSIHIDELWVSMVEKAFAKALGNYQEISTMKIQKVLLHLTGGSVQQISLYDEATRLDLVNENAAWSEFKRRCSDDCLVLLMPSEKKMSETAISEDPDDLGRVEEDCFLPGKLYSVVLCKELGGYELVLMHNPWNDPNHVWTGEWSDQSNDWDLYPELLVEVEKDPTVPWSRRHPNGYFWIAYRSCVKHFSKMLCCRLFPNEKFNFYCTKGESKGTKSGGSLSSIRDRDLVLKDAATSKFNATHKSTAAVVVDGDPSWFCNPQYKITCSSPATVYISLIPLLMGDENDAENIYMTMTSMPKSISQPNQIWEITNFDVIATDSSQHTNKVKGQEISIWGIHCDPKHVYHIVPNSIRRGIEADFILRVFSSSPVVLEGVPSVMEYKVKGEWKKVGDLDTTGGALEITQPDGKIIQNPKWCQNPQFHLELQNPNGKDEIYLKVVLQRTDKGASKGGQSQKNVKDSDGKGKDATCGIVITKAEILVEDPSKPKKKSSKYNRFGEPILPKESSLKKPRDLEEEEAAKKQPEKTILRKLSVDSLSYHQSSGYNHKTEAVIFYPKLPRLWIPNGFIITPSLSEKGIKGSFELSVYSSEKIFINQLPETYSRTIAGEWTDSSSGGSHVCSEWKKNPKYALKLHYPVNSDAPVRVRITLSKYGPDWKTMSRKDTVGCMVGFYIFSNRYGELTQVYESTFGPDIEISTDPSFTLNQLPHGEVYTIMPVTFGEKKIGPYVLSLMSECEFTFSKEK